MEKKYLELFINQLLPILRDKFAFIAIKHTLKDLLSFIAHTFSGMSDSNLLSVQDLLGLGKLEPLNPNFKRVLFNDLQTAKEFAAALKRIGFGNRQMPDEPKKIEPLNINTSQESYAVDLTHDEYNALQSENRTARHTFSEVGEYEEKVLEIIHQTRLKMVVSFKERIREYAKSYLERIQVDTDNFIQKECDQFLQRLVSYWPDNSRELSESRYCIKDLKDIENMRESLANIAQEYEKAENLATMVFSIKSLPCEEQAQKIRDKRNKRYDRLIRKVLQQKNNIPYEFRFKEEDQANKASNKPFDKPSKKPNILINKTTLKQMAGLVDPDAVDEKSGSNLALMAIQNKLDGIYRFLVLNRVDIQKKDKKGLSAVVYVEAGSTVVELQKFAKELIRTNDAQGELLREMRRFVYKYLDNYSERKEQKDLWRNSTQISDKIISVFLNFAESLFKVDTVFNSREEQAKNYLKEIDKALQETPVQFSKKIKAISDTSNWGRLNNSQLHKKMTDFLATIQNNEQQYMCLIDSSELLQRELNESNKTVQILRDENRQEKIKAAEQIKQQEIAHNLQITQINLGAEAKLEQAKETHVEEMEQAQETHAEKLKQAQETHAEEMKQAQETHAEKLKQAQETYVEQMKQAQKTYVEEMRQVQKTHNEEKSQKDQETQEILSRLRKLEEGKKKSKKEQKNKEAEKNDKEKYKESQKDVGASKHRVKIKTVLEKCLPDIPLQLDETCDGDDYFFPAFSQELNQLTITKNCNEEFLRKFCNTYVQDQKPEWLKWALIADGIDYEQYFKLEAKNEERNKVVGDSINDKPHIKGRMICEKFDVKLHIVEVIEDSLKGTKLVEKLIDRNGSHLINQMDQAGYLHSKTAHLAVYKNCVIPFLNRDKLLLLQREKIQTDEPKYSNS